MPADKICKTVHQYSKVPLSAEDMQKLQEIAEDYRTVKNYVYDRFGGIGSLPKLYPGYTIQNEMTKSGLRERLGMPSAYFYLAVFDALGDIKSQWSRTKTKVLECVGKNEGFSDTEKHYLRFLMKNGKIFEAVLNREPIPSLPEEYRQAFDEMEVQVDTEHLQSYLCRQVRKHHIKQHTDLAEGFALSERTYRYGDHGIYITTKEKRRRIFIPLTDNNRYERQLYIKLFPETNKVVFRVPVDVAVRSHPDYTGRVGIALGFHTMLTTEGGNRYGEELGNLQREYADWMRMQTGIYNRNRENNPGRKKFHAKKRRFQERLHGYVNQELNRFLRTEKPETVYMAKLPGVGSGGKNRRINQSLSMWQRGYIRKRLEQKCEEQSVELVQVFGKGISGECSRCGASGIKKEGRFFCPVCGYEAEEKMNTARNARERGGVETPLQ